MIIQIKTHVTLERKILMTCTNGLIKREKNIKIISSVELTSKITGFDLNIYLVRSKFTKFVYVSVISITLLGLDRSFCDLKKLS